jgi:hypothetical protein
VPRKRPVVSTDLRRKAVETFNRTGIDFVFTELDVALTFCRESLSAREQSKAIRAARYARLAFDVALRKRKEFAFSASEKKEFAKRVLQLKILFREVRRRKIPYDAPELAEHSQSPERQERLPESVE